MMTSDSDMRQDIIDSLRPIIDREIKSLRLGLESSAVDAAKTAWCDETTDNILTAVAVCLAQIATDNGQQQE